MISPSSPVAVGAVGGGGGVSSRAIRLFSDKSPTSSSSSSVSIGNYFIHQMILKALSHSLKAKLLFLNEKVLNKIQELAENSGSLHNKELLSRPTLLSILFQLIDEQEKGEENDETMALSSSSSSSSSSPVLIAFNDNLHSWLLRNKAASSVILDEMKNKDSKAFFFMIDPIDELRVGQTLPSFSASADASSSSQQQQQQQSSRGDGSEDDKLPPSSSSFSSFFNSFPNPFASSSTSPLPPPGSSFFIPSPPPPSPPGHTAHPSSPSSQAQPHMMYGRTYQVTVVNGTATMTPLGSGHMMPFPPGMMPPPGSNGMMFPMPAPSQATIKKFLAAQQQQRQQEKEKREGKPKDAEDDELIDSLDEDVTEFLSDPENLAKVKVSLSFSISFSLFLFHLSFFVPAAPL
jgi:hypothetical protein